MSSASSANLPRIISASGRTLRALMRAKRCVALYGIRHQHYFSLFRRWSCRWSGAGSGRGGLRLLRLAAVTFERSRWSELAQPMAHHVLCHEHLQVRLAVVDHERQAHKLGHDRTGASPRLDRLFRAALLGGLHLLVHLEVHKGTFFLGSAHVCLMWGRHLACRCFMAGWKPVPGCYTSLITPYRRDLRRRTIALFDALPRVRVRPPLAGTPVGLTGCRPPLVRPSPPPCG